MRLPIVIVTDANGCIDADTFIVSQPTLVSPVIASPSYVGGNNISCAGGNDGSVSVTAGGTPPYSYLWNTGGTSSNLSSLVAGTYTVMVTDANGCSGTDDILLLQPLPINIDLTPSVYTGGFNISCVNDSDGSIYSSMSGGTGAMAWNWSTGSTSSSISGLTAGTYSVTITDSTGCSAVDFITLAEPSAIVINSVLSTYNGYNVSCHGSNDGNINLTISGGIPGYHFLWNDSVAFMNRVSLLSGVYVVQVFDTNLCMAIDTITLTEPDSITVFTSGSMLTCYGDANGVVYAEAQGGNSPFTYLWSNGTTNQEATGLATGIYQVTVTDSRGCTKVSTAEVQQPQELIGYAFGTYIDCGSQIGLLSVTASGGTAPYTFLWSNGSTSAFQTNLPVGNYSVTVTDSHGCIDTAFAIILNPPDLFAVVTNSSVQCENSTDGILTVAASGGVTPYMYLWSNGITTAINNNLGIGNYTVIVTDANGCTAIATAAVSPLTVISNSFTPFTSCTGGSNTITVSAGGGTAPYTYLWNTGVTSALLSNVTNGTYTVTTTDANGCIGTDTTSYNGFVVTANGPTVFCHGDSVILTASGGSSYLWSNGETTQTVTIHSTGNFTVAVDGCNSGYNINTLVTYCQQDINLKVFIEGFYVPAIDSMVAVLDPINLPLICDSISVSLVDSASLQTHGVVNDVISTAGTGLFYFGSLLPGKYYYIVVKHRNSIETWSKTPLLFLTPSSLFDFTAP
ncbi:MAG: SprB repeat-containing protein [Bacteroidetes bacterium]|nr:SprB repeat-containing protein [Bacteroidota bacterium]